MKHWEKGLERGSKGVVKDGVTKEGGVKEMVFC